MRVDRLMPSIRPIKQKKPKRAAIVRPPGRPGKPSPKLAGRGSHRGPLESAAEIARTRAEAEAAIAERIARLYQPGERHEQKLADGRVILIEERLTEEGGIIGLCVDITELKHREASFRLLFDSNPVPMIVCALDDERILSVNDAAIAHYGYGRVEFEKLRIRSLQAFDSDAPWPGGYSSDEQAARTWKHVKADGTLIDLAPRKIGARAIDLFALTLANHSTEFEDWKSGLRPARRQAAGR